MLAEDQEGLLVWKWDSIEYGKHENINTLEKLSIKLAIRKEDNSLTV